MQANRLGRTPTILTASSRYRGGRRAFRPGMRLKVIVVLGALLVAAACQLPGSISTCNAQIDWVNFIQVGSTQYVAGQEPANPLQQGDLGAVYANVKHKVSGNVCDPNYRLKDGDAAYLEVGTHVYVVSGHPPTEELAAWFNGSIAVYFAMGPAPGNAPT
jgi:hypothetical protein